MNEQVNDCWKPSWVKALTAAIEEVEDEEDEHIFTAKGRCRELWIQSL
ncbi:MAG: hypothetical protein H7X91_11260 [Burkholderiales bacterium]|nr:hypothetical protein [Burkholderiales bacterium]